jgi:hypothetical protein
MFYAPFISIKMSTKDVPVAKVISVEPVNSSEEVEESEIEINEEDETRLGLLKDAVRKSVQNYLVDQPLKVLLNKSDNGHGWKKINIHSIVHASLERLQLTLPWLSFTEMVHVLVNEEGEIVPGGGAVEVCCKVNEAVYFCFNIRFSPLSRCLNRKPVDNPEVIIDLKPHSSEAYEQTKTIEELLSTIVTDFKKPDQVFVVSNIGVPGHKNQFTLRYETLTEVQQKAEFRLQNSVEDMHEHGFSFAGRHIAPDTARIFFGVLFVMGHSVTFSEEISFYG